MPRIQPTMILSFSGECGIQLGASPLSGQFSGSRARHGRLRRHPSRCHVTCSIWCCSLAFSRHSASPLACSSASWRLRASSNCVTNEASKSIRIDPPGTDGNNPTNLGPPVGFLLLHVVELERQVLVVGLDLMALLQHVVDCLEHVDFCAKQLKLGISLTVLLAQGY